MKHPVTIDKGRQVEIQGPGCTYRQIHLHMNTGEILIIGENGYKICCILRIDIEFEMGEN